METKRLEAWLKQLDDDHCVIGYAPNSVFGFYPVEKNDLTDGLDGLPIRRPVFSLSDEEF